MINVGLLKFCFLTDFAIRGCGVGGVEAFGPSIDDTSQAITIILRIDRRLIVLFDQIDLFKGPISVFKF